MNQRHFVQADRIIARNYGEIFNAHLGINIQIFNECLQRHNAIVSGGSILSWGFRLFGNFTDIDIYVPSKHIKSFLLEIAELLNVAMPRQINMQIKSPSAYCRSFLKRNNITRIYVIAVAHQPFIDIMEVKDISEPTKVVSNFDLTFCECYYDGRHVMVNYPEHIATKTGFLRKDYILDYLSGNCFIKKRIEKYLNRGFTIDFDPSFDPSSILRYHIKTFQERRTINPADIINAVIQRIIFYNILNISYNVLSGYKNINFIRNLPDDVLKYDPNDYNTEHLLLKLAKEKNYRSELFNQYNNIGLIYEILCKAILNVRRNRDVILISILMKSNRVRNGIIDFLQNKLANLESITYIKKSHAIKQKLPNNLINTISKYVNDDDGIKLIKNLINETILFLKQFKNVNYNGNNVNIDANIVGGRRKYTYKKNKRNNKNTYT
jgi:hypothetical protein